MKNDLCVATSLQTNQIFDTVLSPWYLPRVLLTRGYEPDSGKSGPVVPGRYKVPAGPVVRALPRRRPRLEQVSIRSNLLRSQAKRPQTLKLMVYRYIEH
jgi:hypothetical protein